MEMLSLASPVVPAKVTCPLAKVAPVKTGTGACVSSVLRVKASEALPVLPAASVSPATMVCAPAARPVGVYDQAPVALAVVVAAMAVPSTVKWTTAPGSAVPVRAGLAVILSLAEAPVSLARPAVTAGAVDEGGGGDVVLSVKASEALPVL